MANNPVMGVAVCPYCKNNNPIIWNSNFRWVCTRCRRSFMVKRQKLMHVKPIKVSKEEGV